MDARTVNLVCLHKELVKPMRESDSERDSELKCYKRSRDETHFVVFTLESNTVPDTK